MNEKFFIDVAFSLNHKIVYGSQELPYCQVCGQNVVQINNSRLKCKSDGS